MMKQPTRKVKLFFPKLRDQGLPPTIKNTIPLDEQINTFIDLIHANNYGKRKMIDVKYQFQIINSKYYEGEFERALLIYEEEEV